MKTTFFLPRIFLVAFAALAMAITYFAAPTAHAKPNATIVVNSLADTSGGVDCTLRDAILAANWNTVYGGCSAGAPGADTITFGVIGTITLTGGLGGPLANEPLEIIGPTGGITIDGAGLYRAFSVGNQATLTISNLTIANAFSSSGGGAAAAWCSYCALNVDHVTFIGNRSNGGIQAGGALFNRVSATLTVTSSTFISNTAPNGGAIANYGALYITNSTFISNTANNGAAITNQYTGTTTIVNSTFANHLGNSGVQTSGTAITLRNTIIANTSGANCSGGMIDGDFNLQFGGTVAGSCGATIPTLDPLLGELGNHGGKTQTIMLLPASPAINAIIGNANCPVTDQRDVRRAVGLWCDIGAYEAASIVGFFPFVQK